MKLGFKQAIQEIKNRLDIVSVVQKYITLKRSGQNYVGMCPFHNDTKPSMYLSPRKEIFKCFACGAGGDLFKFVMEYQKMSFTDAVHQLASDCGIEIEASAHNEENNIYYEINQVAQKYYRDSIKTNNEALSYLRDKRQLSNETIEEFGIGYSPNDVQGLTNHLKEQGYTDKETLLNSGLCLQSSHQEDKLIDRFRGRIMIPIYDLDNRVIAFGSRILVDQPNQAKYINSPETPIFKKGSQLYNLNNAREYTRQEQKVLLLEGYFDVIQAHQNGIKYGVAALGTAFTSGQARLLYNSNLARKIILGFDMDDAGLNAGKKALTIFQQTEFKDQPRLRFLELSDYKDIDEYLMALGPESLNGKIENANDAYEFFINHEASKTDLSNPEERRQTIKQLAEMIEGIKDSVYKEILAEKVARQFSLTKQTIMQALKKKVQNTTAPPKIRVRKATQIKQTNQTAEILLSLLFLTDNEDYINQILDISLNDSYLDFQRGQILEMSPSSRLELFQSYLKEKDLTEGTNTEFSNLFKYSTQYKDIPIDEVIHECITRLSEERKAIDAREKLRNF